MDPQLGFKSCEETHEPDTFCRPHLVWTLTEQSGRSLGASMLQCGFSVTAWGVSAILQRWSRMNLLGPFLLDVYTEEPKPNLQNFGCYPILYQKKCVDTRARYSPNCFFFIPNGYFVVKTIIQLSSL